MDRLAEEGAGIQVEPTIEALPTNLLVRKEKKDP